MSILVISIIVSIVLMIAIAVVVAYFNKRGNLNKRAFIFIPLGLLGMLLTLSEMFITIHANEVGIVYHDFGGLKDDKIKFLSCK